MKKTAPLSTPIRSRSRPRVVGRDLLAELGDAALQRRSSSIRTSPTPRSSSVCVTLRSLCTLGAHVRRSTMPGTATTSSPRTTSGHASRSERGTFASTNTSCTFFLRPASRSPGSPAAYLKAWHARRDRPRAPAHLARRARPAPRSSQTRSYSRTRLHAAAEVERASSPRARRAARRARAASCGARPRGGARFASRAGVELLAGAAGSRSRIRPRFVSRFDESTRNVEALGAAVRLGLVAPARRAAGGRRRPRGARLIAVRRRRSRRGGRGRSRPGRRPCARSRAAGRRRTRSGARAARPRSCPAARRRRPRRRAPRGRSARPRRTRAPRRPWSTWSAETP